MALHATVAYAPTCYRSSVINFKSTGATEIIPARSGKRFFVVAAWVEYTTVTSISAGTRFTLGNNASTYDNAHQMSADFSYPSSDFRNQVPITLFVSGGRFTLDVGSTGIFVKVTQAATGTTMNGVVVIEGFYY